MWKPINIALSLLLIVDSYFVAYAVGLNIRHVGVVDPRLGQPKPAVKDAPVSAPVTASATEPTPAAAKAATEALAASFTDLDKTDIRLKPIVMQAAEAGIIDPTKDKKFRPNDPVTRADFTRWMVRVRQVSPASPADSTYSDLDPYSRYFPEVEGATQAMMVQGYTAKDKAQKDFKPNQFITREEFAVMYGTFSGKRGRAEKLSKDEVAKYLRFHSATTDFGDLTYTDVGDVDDWAQKWVAVAHQAGVLEQAYDVDPYSSDQLKRQLHPLQKMTRAEAVNILVKLYGLHSRTVVEICEGLDKEGLLLDRPGDYEVSEALQEGSLAMKEKAFGKDNPQVAMTLTNLANLNQGLGKHEKAEPLIQQALAIREKANGPESQEAADSMNALASSYKSQGKYKEAEALYQKLLVRDKKVTGDRSAQVASDLDNLSKLQNLLGKKPDAEVLDKQALEVKQKLPGAQNLATLKSFDNAPKTSGTERPVKDKWALVIGISNFKDPSINLKYAAKDATDFRNYLTSEKHFQPDHVRLLTNSKATRDNIVGQLGDKWLGRLANKDDLVVVYVSSHGSQAKEEVGVNFLVAYDTNKHSLLGTGIPMQWLSKIIKEQVHSDRVVLILDVCHAGAAVSADKSLTRVGFDISKLSVGSGQAVMCSSLADQLSWESKTHPNSVFTRRLIEGLRLKGDKTKLNEAYDFVRDNVESEVLRDRGELQTPVLNMSMWQGEAPVLSVKAASPRPGIAGDAELKK